MRRDLCIGALTLLVVLGVLVVVGCSAGARDRLMRFFFDIPEQSTAGATTSGEHGDGGAPPDSAPTGSAGPERLTLPDDRFASVHPPFAERSCAVCHDAGQRMRVREDVQTACRTCHQRYFSEEVGHFPVSQGDCLTCHDPHRSRVSALLRQGVRETCTDCHESPEELSQPAHAGDGAGNCTRCHDAHFGKSPLLKPGVRAAHGEGG
jgi:predicted CXXCH cytochrome family protein